MTDLVVEHAPLPFASDLISRGSGKMAGQAVILQRAQALETNATQGLNNLTEKECIMFDNEIEELKFLLDAARNTIYVMVKQSGGSFVVEPDMMKPVNTNNVLHVEVTDDGGRRFWIEEGK